MTAVNRLFAEGFRLFFLGACLFSLGAMTVWEVWLFVQAQGGAMELPAAVAPGLWHAHEMIFGYAGATLAGFLLTAGGEASGALRRFVPLAFLIWLAGRVAIWTSGLLPPAAVAMADLAFLPTLAWKLGQPLLVRPKPQQMLLLAVVCLVWSGNLSFHLAALGLWEDGASRGVRAAMLAHSAMLLAIKGRLIPGFTRNAMMQAGREDGHPLNPPALAALSIAPALALPVAVLAGAPEAMMATLALVAGMAGLARLALWRSGWTVNRPMLWTLHLAFLMNAAGLIALASAFVNAGSEIGALHLIGIGGIGGITISILSRLTLGLTGRPIEAPRPLVLAYAAVPLAAAMRFAGAIWPALYHPASLAAGALWLAAFTAALFVLLPAWLGPRLPRAPVTRRPPDTDAGARRPP